MLKKITAIMIAVIMTFGCLCVCASAEATAITVSLNQENSVSLKAGEVKTFTLSLSGYYTIITTGAKNVDIKTVSTSGSDTYTHTLDKASNGNIFDTSEYGVSILGISLSAVSYNFEISASDGKACSFKLWVIDFNSSNSGFTSKPTTTTTYREDVDFTVSGSTVTFKNGPDFTGAVFSFNDDNNNPIYTLKDGDVINVLSAPVFTYSAGTIVYTSIATVASGRSTITFKASPNYIKTAVFSNLPKNAFTFCQGGKIKGTLGSFYYQPDVSLDGAKVTVTYKDYLGADSETLEVQKDSTGYYITTTYGGRQDITINAKITKNETATVNVPVLVGNCSTTIPVSITKLSFFSMLIIYIGLLFGSYK